jgi:hypothetical protein
LTTEPDNNASLSRQLAEAEAETARLRKLLSSEAKKSAAWQAAHALGPVAALLVPLILEHTRAVVDETGVRVEVLGKEGRPRFVYQDSHARPMTPADLLAELKTLPTFQRVFTDQTSAEEKPEAAQAARRNLTDEIREAARQAKSKANDELRNACLAKNPFAAGSFNLTRQSVLAKADPELAARLKREAAA